MLKTLCLSVLACAAFAASPANATCAKTGFVRGERDLTAVLVNPPHAVVNRTIDARGCDMGVYFGPGAEGSVRGSEIFGAAFFGIVRDGAVVDIVDNRIHDIGYAPFLPTKHGIGIYCTSRSHQPSGGDVVGNTLWNYQRAGIVLNGQRCGASTVAYNSTQGAGTVNWIAQIGIQVRGASDVVLSRNTTSGHSYAGPDGKVGVGALHIGGDCFHSSLVKRNQVVNNAGVGNDVGIFAANLNDACNFSMEEPTDNKIADNTLFSNALKNVTGNEGSGPFQFGIVSISSNDTVSYNGVCGAGYSPAKQPPGGLVGQVNSIGSRSPTIVGNKCYELTATTPLPTSTARQSAARGLFNPSTLPEPVD